MEYQHFDRRARRQATARYTAPWKTRRGGDAGRRPQRSGCVSETGVPAGRLVACGGPPSAEGQMMLPPLPRDEAWPREDDDEPAADLLLRDRTVRLAICGPSHRLGSWLLPLQAH